MGDLERWGGDDREGVEGGREWSGGREGVEWSGVEGGELTLPVGVQPQCLQLLEQCPSAMFQWQVQVLHHVKHIPLAMIVQHLRQSKIV